jgi:hypothetical protein
MLVEIDKKFSEKHVDNFINLIYTSLKRNPNGKYIFDLSETEWISNQNLLLFTSILKYFYAKKIDFKVKFLKEGISSVEINDRVKLQLLQLWEIWEIYSVIGEQDYSKYFDVNDSTIKNFKNELISKGKYNEKSKELYNRFGITPFITLNKINNYKDNELFEFEIKPIYQLNNVIEEKLFENKCNHPFLNNTLSAIITKELYENFLDHSNKSLFNIETDWAFMSLALKQKQKDDNQSILELNFKNEEIPETIDFFKIKKAFKNESLIQFSFLDFGDGIPNTLRDQYIVSNNINSNDLFHDIKDNDILKFAFKHNSSRNPILNLDENENLFIPRGLFDLLTIVKRYNGLIIIRSNYGKILYDFSQNKNFDEAFKEFGNDSQFFPGTFISIYLPALLDDNTFDKSVIKPKFEFKSDNIEIINNINIYTILKKIDFEKTNIYNNLIKELSKELFNNEKNTLNYISFLGCKDERIIKKTIFYLLTDYNVNINNNIVVLHPPVKEILTAINDEVLNLNKIIKDFKIHPIPFVYLNKENNDIEIEWIGIFDAEDKSKLNQYLLEGVLFPKTDFNDVDNIFGNLHFQDKHGNIHSKIPKVNTFLSYYSKYEVIDDVLIENLILENNCIKEDGLYLCNGNYYQNKFLQLIDILNNYSDCNEITRILFEKIKAITLIHLDSINYIAITSSSHKILYSLIKQKLINENQCLFYDSYSSFEKDIKSNEIKTNSNYILVCDAISTGNLTRRIENIILELNSKLLNVAVIANTLDINFEYTQKFIDDFKDRLVHLYKFPIEKKRRHEIINKDSFKNVIRINPYTNIPITFSENLTLRETILIENSDFIEYISNADININFKIFNNLIHPYFFNLKNILKNENEKIDNQNKSLLNLLFNELLKDKIQINDKLKIFYPKNSDIKSINFDKFISRILNNQSIDIFELERFNTDEGWKFPHTTDFYLNIVKDNNVLIFDDGSCTGDSLLQMINELSIFQPKKIDLICIVGRVNDHKREFFSKIDFLKYNKNIDDYSNSQVYGKVDVKIYFASHWHISTFYLNNSPYSNEINWLKDLLKIQNTPVSIKNIGERIYSEISPKRAIEKDYDFFPKIRNSNEIPKKELILVRNEIGKIIGYRFYKESFNWFNEFIAKYESSLKTIDRYKEIELLCIALLYEPYLYDKISTILPDVKDKIEEFIDSLIFGNPKKNNLKIKIEKDLNFDWSKNKRDIIHLFFIIYKDDKLIQKLTFQNFKELINFSKDTFKKTNPINYLFYKLLRIFPLNAIDSISNKNSINTLKEFFYKIIEEKSIDNKSLKETERFYSFISTLPTGNDFNSQIIKIKDIYRQNDLPKLHDEREAYGVNFSSTISSLRELSDLCRTKKPLSEYKIKDVRKGWWNMKNNLINPIISFFRSFEDFFKPYPYMIFYNQIDGKESSLINLYTFIDDFIFNIEQKGNDLNNFNKAVEYLLIIDEKIGVENEEFRGLFINPKINYKVFLNNLYKKVEKSKYNFEIKNEINVDFEIYIPQLYVEILILNEIFNNLEFYGDVNETIQINFIKDKEGVNIHFKNYYSNKVKEFSSGEGINSLNQLSNSNLFNFVYENSVDRENKIFNQTLKFNIWSQQM